MSDGSFEAAYAAWLDSGEWSEGIEQRDMFRAGWDARAPEVGRLNDDLKAAHGELLLHECSDHDLRARLAAAEARAGELEAAARELVRVLDADLEEGTLPVQERAMERLMIVAGEGD